MGLGLLLLGVFISLITKNWGQGLKISGVLGLVSIIISAIISGALVSGDRVRANYATESSADSQQRRKLSLTLFLIGLPSMVTIIIYFLLAK